LFLEKHFSDAMVESKTYDALLYKHACPRKMGNTNLNFASIASPNGDRIHFPLYVAWYVIELW
jgi:hypothetical protein